MSYNLDTGPTRERSPLRVGLVGVTGYALAYFEEINKLVDKGLVVWGAVTIINPDDAPEQVAFFKSRGIPIYSDYEQMLDKEGDDLDWMCVPTAIGWHTRMAVKTLRCGIPLLLEKPIAPTLQDVDSIQAAEQEAGLPVAIGFQHNYSPSALEIKRRLLAGDIGEVLRIDCICLWPRAESYYTRNYWSGCLHDGESWVLDSPLHNAISHVVNLILFFAGTTIEGRADLTEVEAELYRAKPIQSYDTIRSQVRLDTGVSAGIVLSHSSMNSFDPEIRISGTKGTCIWRFCGSHTFEIGGQKETMPPECQIEIRECMFENVARLIQGDSGMLICTTDQARGEVKWVNAVQDAAAIHDVPEKYRRRIVDKSGEIFDIIEDLDSIAMRVYEKHCSFSDLNVPWAVTPGSLELSDYSSFQARQIPAGISQRNS